jgi:polyisoprenoid-binding protein YceI
LFSIVAFKNFIPMKGIMTLLTFQFLFLLNVAAQERFTADTMQTKLLWLGEKVTGQHTGTVNLKSGWITWKDNKIVSGEFDIDMTSLKESESNARLEGHLKSDDFFAVVKFPVAILSITGSTPFDKGTGVVSGTLTIKGVTNPLEFKAALQKKDDGMWFYANIVVDRTKYNIRYGSGNFYDNLGDKTIFDEFKVKVNLFVK